MALIRLIYQSTLTSDCEPTLSYALRTGRRNNCANHLTGMTLVAGRQVLEILEGEGEVVKQTFERIAADSRHHISRVLSEEVIYRRHFSKWNAGYRQNVVGYERHSWKDDFFFDGADPFNAHACPAELEGLLDDFSEKYAAGT